ncbi:conserved Plasmodium protein, unknown function [Plasmodium knowlesi strain H]|uniref:Uncharacterized protein n=3 Tax=Plasmodium knowlesi TaxID=5850 RepID=A0A5K1VM26_PLAKH|nr:conserved Plasmodium protein, unknown function [Plasmodium knowlesi strain H]OTN66306.1 Uncharacterized protein PKNOH_S09522100 [Plasmodium knowlesi]CAA9986389.1 conserved Plasmodium protein, unknown function [Plasmodium knowlesi strain H]SBO25657.1 conserved Plasmodium protein, unknown function [Plasmodium knowlesi strain H]SBO28374.1 conserved Plasmodium protein, unknown function [Plasmodium knowlesi strain H]VVS75863.1 conserved Plasmodium protein, unknown function [Plasmodium knowlesi s|eukprot:XP_002257795.1 hypothetical protein, conserved in Plasmodium species [Plasmodium knowlesi strain H]
MKCKEQKAYLQFVEELKKEFPLFRKYTDDFFYRKKKEETQRGNESSNFFSQNGEAPNDTKEACNSFVREMETSFNSLEQKNRISCICKLFLNNYSPFTNGYYNYVDTNYVSSSLVQEAMERYVEWRESGGEESFAQGHISETNAVSVVTPPRLVARRPHKRESVGDTGNALGWDNAWASDSAGENVIASVCRDVADNVIDNVNDNGIGSVRGDASAAESSSPHSNPRSSPRSSPRSKASGRRTKIGKRSRKSYETGAKVIGKSPRRGKYSDRGVNAKRAKVWEGSVRVDKGGGPKDGEDSQVINGSRSSRSRNSRSSTSRSSSSSSSGRSLSRGSNWSNGSRHSNAMGDLKNCVEEEMDKKDDLGFCDISLVPFANETFYINYGCVGTSKQTHKAGSVFVIDDIGGGCEKNEIAKCKRRIIFGREGKKEFLHNISSNSIVKGWIYKADSEHKFFHVRLFSVRNTPDGSSGNKTTDVTENSKTANCGSGAGVLDDHHVYACLPFQFVSKFQFVDSLDMHGLRLEENLDSFIGMNIRARIFDDREYIRSHFEDLLGRYQFHFFLTLQSKGHDDHIKNDKLGFLSTELSVNNLTGQKKLGENIRSEVDSMLVTRLNVLLFSCKRFMSKENVKYKEKYLFLNLPHLSSLINFNFRNNFFQTHIGNVTTRKQNLIWSEQKFMEALEIYKKNSNYYNFLKNYFTFHSGSSTCSYVYLSDVDKFETTNNEHTAPIKVEANKHVEKEEQNEGNPKQRNYILEKKKEKIIPGNNFGNLKMDGNKSTKCYEDYWFSLSDREKHIVDKIPFLNSSVYKTKWIYDFFNCIKLTINLNNHHLWGNFLLSLVLLELSCYTESFLFLFRIFKIKKMFLESYKLKNIICTVFIRRLKKYIAKEHLWNVIVNYREYDLFSMREDNCDEYCRNIFERNLSLLCALEKG